MLFQFFPHTGDLPSDMLFSYNMLKVLKAACIKDEALQIEPSELDPEIVCVTGVESLTCFHVASSTVQDTFPNTNQPTLFGTIP